MMISMSLCRLKYAHPRNFITVKLLSVRNAHKLWEQLNSTRLAVPVVVICGLIIKMSLIHMARLFLNRYAKILKLFIRHYRESRLARIYLKQAKIKQGKIKKMRKLMMRTAKRNAKNH